jgi:drug/metabolite transporter (DMT)-like permease
MYNEVMKIFKANLRQPGAYLVIVAVLCTSASSIFIRLSNMPPLVIAFYRMAVSTVFLFMPFILKTKRILKISRRDVLLWMFSGIALALHFGAWIASLSHTSVAASTVLVSLSPVFVALINMVVFKKKPGKMLFLCLTLAIFGTVVISTGSYDRTADEAAQNALTGNLLALMGGFFVAVYLMIGQNVRKRVTTAVYAFWVYGFATAALLLCCLAFSQPLAPYGALDFVNIAAMALVCSVGGHTFYNMLLKYHGAALISLASLCEPVFASILAVFIISDIPHITTVFGGVIVIFGVAVYILTSKRID